jgi:hypothetical protein
VFQEAERSAKLPLDVRLRSVSMLTAHRVTEAQRCVVDAYDQDAGTNNQCHYLTGVHLAQMRID